MDRAYEKRLRMQAMHLYDKMQKTLLQRRAERRKNEKYLREKARMQAVHLYDKMQKRFYNGKPNWRKR